MIAGVPVSVTDDPNAARADAENVFAIYGTLPSYRAMLDREGAAGPGDIAVVGDEDTVRKGHRRLRRRRRDRPQRRALRRSRTHHGAHPVAAPCLIATSDRDAAQEWAASSKRPRP